MPRPPPDPRELRQDLRRLAERDPKFDVFGAIGHRYLLHPVLSLAEVRSFEVSLGLRLPEEYVTFLTMIGNGGAGPFYGVHSLGQCDGLVDVETWHPHDDLVGDPTKPFPYRTAWNRSPAELQLDQETDEADLAYFAEVDGAFPICHEGCAYRDWLVVTGPERGYVWHDELAGDGGWWPWTDDAGRHVTFLEWYDLWLRTELEGRPFRARPPGA